MKKNSYFVNKSGIIVWAMVLMIVAMPAVIFAQEQTIYALVEYMKVKQGDEQKYVDLETKYWKKIHQERVNKKEIVRWVLYHIPYAGSNDEYNYVTVALVDDLNKIENPYADIDPEKLLQGEDVDKIMQETGNSRQLVRRDLIYMVSSVYPDAGLAPFQYVQIDFMKVRPENINRYLEVENNVWKPVHKEFINDGSRGGWTLWQTVYPSGSGRPYQYVTANYINQFSQMGAANYNSAFEKAHAGKDINKLMEETDKSRELVRSELWRVLDMVE